MKNKFKLSSLSVFFPMYNEEANVERVLSQAKMVLPDVALSYEIIVINDGSTDKTSEIVHKIANKDGHIKVVDQENTGYGGALRTGFNNAKYQWVFFTDGDLQFDLSDLKLFLPYAINNKVILGFRKQRADSLSRIMLAKLLKIWNKVFFNFPWEIKDVDCAFKLFHRDVLSTIYPLYSSGAMISTEMLLKIIKNEFQFIQIGVTHLPRIYGKPSGANIRVILRAVKETSYLFFKKNLR